MSEQIVSTSPIVRRSVGEVSAALARDRHPVLARVLRARGVESPDQVDYSLARLCRYDELLDIAPASELLAEAVRAGSRVLVVGDFDADGATGSAVAVRGLRMLGAAAVDYLVPNRFEYGYGLTPEIVDAAAPRAPDLIITVDNGISSVEGVRRANELGIPVIVTDHHLAGAELPAAAAIVNPNRPGDAFPSKALAGVGVAFYLLSAVRARLRDAGWFAAREQPRLAELLDLVAVGTMADVVPLDQNNRILVAQGLARIRAGHGHPGIQALLAVAGRDLANVTSTDLAFLVGPRLNAAGRLADMSLGIECLLCDDPARASEMARELDSLNKRRREIESDMQEQALEHLDELLPATLPYGLCLHHPQWHQGVIGILASRIKDRVHRPVIAFAPAGEGELKGSARSIPGLHVRDVLDAVATRNPGLLSRFGGHAMAAGLSLRTCDLEAFSRAFDDEVRRQVGADALERRLYTDGPLSGAELGIGLATALERAGPWGQGFPEPLFDGEFAVRSLRDVGSRHLKLVLDNPGGAPVEAIAFNRTRDALPAGCKRVHLAYRLDLNHYRGLTRAQLIVDLLEPA